MCTSFIWFSFLQVSRWSTVPLSTKIYPWRNRAHEGAISPICETTVVEQSCRADWPALGYYFLMFLMPGPFNIITNSKMGMCSPHLNLATWITTRLHSLPCGVCYVFTAIQHLLYPLYFIRSGEKY